MRAARSNDIWRDLYRRPSPHFVSLSVKYRDVVGLGSGSIKFEHPMILLCGENGVGKTTILRLVNRALEQGREDQGETTKTYAKGASTGIIEDCRLSMFRDGIAEEISLAEIVRRNEEDPDWLGVSFVETVSLVPHLQRLFFADSNSQDLLEGVTPRELKGDDLTTIRQLVGRDYDKVELFEIAEYAGFERVPYFRVRDAEAVYGSESMGTGELSLLHLFWEISSSEEKSIVLLEEPESFVAPRSQRVFIDWLASVALQKNLLIIVASHSSQIAERFPPRATILCTRSRGLAVIEQRPAGSVLADRLGILSHRRTIALTEDLAAASLAKGLLAELEPRIFAECVFVEAGSNGAIVTSLKSFPLFDSNRAAIVGVFDGDQTDQHLPWPSLCLPGTEGPEAFARGFCAAAASQTVASAVGCTEERWSAALGGAAGADQHDWLTRVAGEIGLTVETFFSRLAPLLVEAHPIETKRFASEFASKVRRR